MIVFEYPFLFWFVLLPFVVRFLFPLAKGTYGAAIKVPFVDDFEKLKKDKTTSRDSSKISQKFSIHFCLMFIVWFLLVLSLMRPIKVSEPVRLENKGRDILMVTDISTSMLEEDFVYQNRYISRLDAVRAVVSDFTKKRLNDRLGLILFGTNAYLQAPLTFDRSAVLDILETMQAGMAGQSTAIGDALTLALKTLKKDSFDTKNKVIILLTDGENNDGSISLKEAIDLADKEGVKVYTIGIGADQLTSLFGFLNVQTNSTLDEKDLKNLAEKTKGKFFRVKTLSDLIDVYQNINKLEAQNFDENYIYPKTELYYLPLAAALFFSILYFALFYLKQKRKK